MAEQKADPFQEMFEAMRDTATAIIAATTNLKRMADAALGIRGDYNDQREHNERLESMIRQLQADVRDLRQRLNGGH